MKQKTILKITCDKVIYVLLDIISNSIGINVEYFNNLDIDNSILLEELMISVDGVPQMTKIVEQKKRRHINHIISNIKIQIANKYFSEKNSYISEKRMQFEIIKKKINITSIWMTIFSTIEEHLVSNDFISMLKYKIPLLKKIIVSPHSIPGEGEKKIMEYIIENKKTGSYSIYSPDADMIILMLISHNILNINNIDNKIFIIRHVFNNNKNNYCSNEYEYINISELSKKIINYIINNLVIKNYSTHLIKKEYIILDICTILTLLGNDFIPKINSVNSNSDIETILDTYSVAIENKPLNVKDIHIVKKNFRTNKYEINCNNFIDYIYKIQIHEKKLLKERYLSSTYKNYNFLKSIFDKCNIVGYLCENLQKYTSVANSIINIMDNYKNNIQTKLEELIKNVDNNYLKVFLILESNNISPEEEIENKSDNELKIYLSNYMEKNKNTFKPRLKLVKYDKTINSKYHTTNINTNLCDSNLEITDYDKEIYSLEKKLDNWSNLFEEIYIPGYINIKQIYYPPRGYEIEEENTYDEYKKYYKHMFNIDDSITNNIEINNICKEYIKGIFWTFNFYMNMNNSKINNKNVLTWSYKYKHSPLLTQITYYFNTHKRFIRQELENLFMSDICNSVSRDKYLTNKEHALYISSHNKTDIDTKYSQFIENNSDFYINTENTINKIKNFNINKELLLNVKYMDFNSFVRELYRFKVKEVDNNCSDVFIVNF